MRIYLTLLAIVTMFLALMLTSIHGDAHPDKDLDDNIVYIGQDHETTEETAYITQEEIYVFLFLGLDTSWFEISIESPLLDERIYDSVGADHDSDPKYIYCIFPPDTIPPGQYPVNAYLNYTMMEGGVGHKEFEFTVVFLLAWEVREFSIDGDQRLVLVIESYVFLQYIRVEFSCSDGIRLEDPELARYEVMPGRHRFETVITGEGWTLDLTNEKVGYIAEAYPGTDTIQLSQLDVPAEVAANKENVSLMTYVLVGSMLVMTALIIYFIFYKKKESRPVGDVQGGPGEGQI